MIHIKVNSYNWGGNIWPCLPVIMDIFGKVTHVK